MEHLEMSAENGRTRLKRHKNCIAFHEAGHAAGIHLNNLSRQLPPAFFKIIVNTDGDAVPPDMPYQGSDDSCIAKVQGGRLMETMPPPVAGVFSGLSVNPDADDPWLKHYQLAFDTDIINLLVGPLAEAKYVAECDNEPFNHQLVHLDALENYGGGADLAIVDKYLQILPINQQEKTAKLGQLFGFAYNFVAKDAHWAAISQLAGYILGSKKSVICYEHAVAVLDQSLDAFHSRRVLLLGS